MRYGTPPQGRRCNLRGSLRIPKAIRCVDIDMDHSHDMEAHGPFDARYLAFLETITQLRPRLHRYCSRMTGSVMDGEDVVQDALFEAYRKLDQSHREVNAELSRLLHLYGDRFNKRDWDGLRELISADAQLRVVDRFAGRFDESPYFGNYDRQRVPWRLTVAEVEGELAVVVMRHHRDEWRPDFVARLEGIDHHITPIVTHPHFPWVLPSPTS